MSLTCEVILMKKRKVLIFALVICFISIISSKKIYAAEWLDINAVPNSQTKVTLSWKKKNVKLYKIYRKAALKNGNYSKTKKIATLSGNKKTFVDRSVKKNTDYTYKIEGYKKSGKSMKLVWSGETGTYTGWLAPYWDEYYASDYPQSTKLITLVFGESIGMKSSGYKIYRRESGTKSYKVIGTVKCKNNNYFYRYKDNSVKPGHSYYYKVRSYHMHGKKKVYSAYSNAIKMSAVNKNGVYKVSLLTKPEKNLSEFTFKIASQFGNGDLVLTENDWFESESDNMVYNNEPIGLHLKEYSTDGKNWKAVTHKTKVVIKAKDTIYVRLRTSEGIYISNLDLNSSLTTSACKYNGLPSFFMIPLNKSTAGTSPNREFIH